MRTSRIATFAAAIAITALLVGTAAFFTMDTNDVAKSLAVAEPVATATLEPVIVVATR